MKNVLLGVLIGLLIAGLGLGIYYYLTKDKEEVKKEVKEETKEEKLSDDVINRMNDLTYMFDVVEQFEEENLENNLVSNEVFRLRYINYLLQKSVGKSIEEFPEVVYVSWPEYKEKYYDVFGENYQLEKNYDEFIKHIKEKYIGGIDSKVVMGSCRDIKALANDDNICWNGNRPPAPKFTLESTKSKYKDNIYTITGQYKLKELNSNNEIEAGTFEVKYKVKDNKESLLNISLKTN